MPKRLLRALEIKNELNRRISQSDALDGDVRHYRVPAPRQARPEDYGANWHIDSIIGEAVPDCLAVVSRIIGDVKAEVDCSDW